MATCRLELRDKSSRLLGYRPKCNEYMASDSSPSKGGVFVLWSVEIFRHGPFERLSVVVTYRPNDVLELRFLLWQVHISTARRHCRSDHRTELKAVHSSLSLFFASFSFSYESSLVSCSGGLQLMKWFVEYHVENVPMKNVEKVHIFIQRFIWSSVFPDISTRRIRAKICVLWTDYRKKLGESTDPDRSRR